MFDSHTHYYDKWFDEDRDILIPSLFDQGVEGIINVGCDMESSMRSIEIAQRYEKVYAAVGIHPHSAAEVSGNWL
ncbi:MAG: TatD family hydrolase, partial [Clostridia bacterium]|nr:TatD family hydrolase [Clostridia bacterium]